MDGGDEEGVSDGRRVSLKQFREIVDLPVWLEKTNVVWMQKRYR